jgi:hypothetical protein
VRCGSATGTALLEGLFHPTRSNIETWPKQKLSDHRSVNFFVVGGCRFIWEVRAHGGLHRINKLVSRTRFTRFEDSCSRSLENSSEVLLQSPLPTPPARILPCPHPVHVYERAVIGEQAHQVTHGARRCVFLCKCSINRNIQSLRIVIGEYLAQYVFNFPVCHNLGHHHRRRRLHRLYG